MNCSHSCVTFLATTAFFDPNSVSTNSTASRSMFLTASANPVRLFRSACCTPTTASQNVAAFLPVNRFNRTPLQKESNPPLP